MDSGNSSLEKAIMELTNAIKEFRAEVANTYVRKDVQDQKDATSNTRIGKLEDWNTWAVRIVLAIIAAAVFGGLMANGGMK